METITIKDIARICGVGVSTVSRALNNHPDINPETRAHIMEVVEQYDFVPNNSARNLKITSSRTIAVLCKGMSNPFFMKMIKIMEEEIQSRNYSMELRHVDENADEVELAIELEREKKLRGIVFLGGRFTHSNEKLARIGVPFVLSTIFMEKDKNLNFSSVSVDDVVESRKVVDYLIDMGHKRIALMTATKSDTSIGKLRTDGYRAAFKAHGYKVSDELIVHSDDSCEDIYTMENGYNMMKEMLAKGLDFTAVFAISDTIAIGACKALIESGKRIPEDVSVAGFDGIDMGHFYSPSLTTLGQPFDDMARATIRQLFEVIRHNASHERKIFEGELIKGESVAAVCSSGKEKPSGSLPN